MSQDAAPPRKRGKSYLHCCIHGCTNNSLNSPSIEYYQFPTSNKLFPHKVLRREMWLNAVRLKNFDNTPWQPTKNTRICSEHFVGNKKSEDPRSISYNPTIFPEKYRKRKFDTQAAVNRYKRKLKRDNLQKAAMNDNLKKLKVKSKDISISATKAMKDNLKKLKVESEGLSISVTNATNKEVNMMHSTPDCRTKNEIQRKDQEIQVDEFEIKVESNVQDIFICNRYTTSSSCDAETLACRPNSAKVKIVQNKDTKLHFPSTSVSNSDNISGFSGFSSIKSEEEMGDLCGVSINAFQLLLKILSRHRFENDKKQKCSNKSRLLIFLMKMKCGLTFPAISVLFGMDRTAVTNIFYSTLTYLRVACTNFVFWPQKKVVQETMPSVFKPEYNNCRVIIDSTEFVVQQPVTVEQRRKYYSDHKKGYRLKNIIGYTPCGFICLVSKCHGGRATNVQITTSSGMLNLLEPGDLVLGDKEFSQIKSLLDKTGKDILLVMPPFLQNNQSSKEEVEDTFNVVGVRIHIERIMQRIGVFKILDKFTIDMLPYCDDIIFMCCVLVNLQAPIIEEKKK